MYMGKTRVSRVAPERLSCHELLTVIGVRVKFMSVAHDQNVSRNGRIAHRKSDMPTFIAYRQRPEAVLYLSVKQCEGYAWRLRCGPTHSSTRLPTSIGGGCRRLTRDTPRTGRSS